MCVPSPSLVQERDEDKYCLLCKAKKKKARLCWVLVVCQKILMMKLKWKALYLKDSQASSIPWHMVAINERVNRNKNYDCYAAVNMNSCWDTKECTITNGLAWTAKGVASSLKVHQTFQHFIYFCSGSRYHIFRLLLVSHIVRSGNKFCRPKGFESFGKFGKVLPASNSWRIVCCPKLLELAPI